MGIIAEEPPCAGRRIKSAQILDDAMQKLDGKRQLKYWPSPQDYNEAVQNLHANTSDADLQAGQIELSPLGLPRPITGAFASVYKVTSGDKDWALRCFLRDIPDTQWRYGRIADFLHSAQLPYTVPFDFEFQGLKIAGRWFPVLKMQWVEGATLDNYVHDRIAEGTLDSSMSAKFLQMCLELQKAGIAHGDLQHGNIMVRSDGTLVLVDYDGMFVPHINQPHSNELGHRNYQHPKRNAQHFGAYLDNFSAWVIYASLKALAVDTSLYQRLEAGEDCLLFRKDDFVNPVTSCAFRALEQHSDEELRRLARFIRFQLAVDPKLVPPLSEHAPEVAELPELSPTAALTRQAACVSPAALVVQDPGEDPWSEAADMKDYLSESSYESTKKAPHAVRPGSIPRDRTNEQLTIPPELFKPAPRKISANLTAGTMQPFIVQLILCVLMVPILIMLMVNDADTATEFYRVAASREAFGIFLFSIASLAIWWTPIQQLFVIRFGKPVKGKIISKNLQHWISTIHVRSGTEVYQTKHCCKVTYEFPYAHKGRVSTRTNTITVSDEQFRSFDEGDDAVVVYLPGGDSVLYKISCWKAV
jgi:hypothetical protein